MAVSLLDVGSEGPRQPPEPRGAVPTPTFQGVLCTSCHTMSKSSSDEPPLGLVGSMGPPLTAPGPSPAAQPLAPPSTMTFLEEYGRWQKQQQDKNTDWWAEVHAATARMLEWRKKKDEEDKKNEEKKEKEERAAEVDVVDSYSGEMLRQAKSEDM